jgi:hypothetical protein
VKISKMVFSEGEEERRRIVGGVDTVPERKRSYQKAAPTDRRRTVS